MNEGNLDLISNIIRKTLKIDCAVLMGANVANDVAQEQFCEATIGTLRNVHYMLATYILCVDSVRIYWLHRYIGTLDNMCVQT